MRPLNLRERARLAPEEAYEHAYLVKTRGYSLVPGFLTLKETEKLKSTIIAAIQAYEPVPGVERSELDKHQIHDLLNRDINFVRLLEDPRLQQLVAPHLGEHWIMYAATSSSIPPGGSNYASRLHVDSPRHTLGYEFNIGILWALDDHTAENGGALKILPGSQHSSETPSEVFFEKHCDRILCKAGSLLVFSARMFHRTALNTTQQWNHSMTLNACRSFMKPRMDWVRFIRPELTEKINAQARRILGFDTRLPTSMEEFFLPEDQRLYKPNQG